MEIVYWRSFVSSPLATINKELASFQTDLWRDFFRYGIRLYIHRAKHSHKFTAHRWLLALAFTWNVYTVRYDSLGHFCSTGRLHEKRFSLSLNLFVRTNTRKALNKNKNNRRPMLFSWLSSWVFTIWSAFIWFIMRSTWYQLIMTVLVKIGEARRIFLRENCVVGHLVVLWWRSFPYHRYIYIYQKGNLAASVNSATQKASPINVQSKHEQSLICRDCKRQSALI